MEINVIFGKRRINTFFTFLREILHGAGREKTARLMPEMPFARSSKISVAHLTPAIGKIGIRRFFEQTIQSGYNAFLRKRLWYRQCPRLTTDGIIRSGAAPNSAAFLQNPQPVARKIFRLQGAFAAHIGGKNKNAAQAPQNGIF